MLTDTVNRLRDGAQQDSTDLESRRRLRVVIVDEELPYPPNSGKRIRTLNLTIRLAKRHQITYVCYRNPNANEVRQAGEFFDAHGIETLLVARELPRKTGLGFCRRLLLNLLSSLPYSVETHTSEQLRRAIRDLAATRRVDLWQCEWTPYAQSLGGAVRGPWVVMAHNVESLIWRRYWETERNHLKRWYVKEQFRKYVRFERRVFREAARTIAVSEDDAALARGELGANRLSVVENGVDLSYFRPSEERRDPNKVLFLGSLDWRPNLDAVCLLVEHALPEVRRRVPSARLVIVGRRPPDWLACRLARQENVELHADVPDVRPFLRNCALMAVPLRIGGGSRLKILEALAMECPVVATKVGAEGLRLTPGKHFVQVEDVRDMGRAIVSSLSDPVLLGKTARLGRQVVACTYDWDLLAQRLEAVWLQEASSGYIHNHA